MMNPRAPPARLRICEDGSAKPQDVLVRGEPVKVECADRLGADVVLGERCPVLGLPSSWDTYLASLSGKHRHELTRRIRRFEREAPEGRAVVARDPEAVAARLGDFLALHRRSRVGKAK